LCTSWEIGVSQVGKLVEYDSLPGLEIFLFCEGFWQVLGDTLPFIKWVNVWGLFAEGEDGQGTVLSADCHLVLRLRML
jgi:hypothetical protein